MSGISQEPLNPLDLTACDREPIHVPGSIQPHGLLLIADAGTMIVKGGAGEIETRLAAQWRGRPLGELLGKNTSSALEGLTAAAPLRLHPIAGKDEMFDVSIHRSGDYLLVELEPTGDTDIPADDILAIMDSAGARLEQSNGLNDLCETAARMFRGLVGYDRVMIYRFQEDEAGVVLAEDRDPALQSFLNHQFPATDIPKQARALYVRNRIRVIPDISYIPAPIELERGSAGEVDLSDAALRSVSPIHLQYLKNMKVGASASISIVKDGALWGMGACHNTRPKRIPLGTRTACRILANGLSQQIRAKDDAELLRERIRLRAAEDRVLTLYEADMHFSAFIHAAGPELMRMFNADGLAVVSGPDVETFGRCPASAELRKIAAWVGPRMKSGPFQTDRLGAMMPEAEAFARTASGLMAASFSVEAQSCILWTRAEKPETVEWAGNPHKGSTADPSAVLTPRSSFESWTDMVRGRSRPWTLAESETAARLVRLMRERRQAARLKRLNQELSETIQENSQLLQQKEFLLREVNHRVQNSLQLVSAFLRLQSREVPDEARNHLQEAERRLVAVALVHRRLYSGESVEIVDLARYIEDLCTELKASMDPRWAETMRLDLAPVNIKADRAVHIGLVFTELVINAQKYAYGGGVGPLAIKLDQHHDQFRLVVADKGAGKSLGRDGFGSKMMAAMVTQMGGALDQADNEPGLRATVTAPVESFDFH